MISLKHFSHQEIKNHMHSYYELLILVQENILTLFSFRKFCTSKLSKNK